MKATANTPRLILLLAVMPLVLACGLLGTPPTPAAPTSTPSAALPTLTPAPVVLAGTPTTAPTLPAAVWCVAYGETWWLRTEPRQDANTMAVLAGGDSVTIAESAGAWRRVTVLTGSSYGRAGWVHSAGLEGCE